MGWPKISSCFSVRCYGKPQTNVLANPTDIKMYCVLLRGFPGLGFSLLMQKMQVWSLVRKIPWGRKWQPTAVFLPRKSHGQQSLVDDSPWGHKGSEMTKWMYTHTHAQTHIYLPRNFERRKLSWGFLSVLLVGVSYGWQYVNSKWMS